MNIKKEKIEALINQISGLEKSIIEEEKKHTEKIEAVYKEYKNSAKNLVHYLAFRSFDLRDTQKKLQNIGMSRLARAEAHVQSSLLKTLFILKVLINEPLKPQKRKGLSIKKGKKLQKRNTRKLLGYRSKNRRVRIMVTQPTEAAYNYPMVYNMVKNGMNCARINCAHDNPEVWLKIIDNVKRASKSLQRKVKIAMDLAGPKIRTGEIRSGAKVRKFSPIRDEEGNILEPIMLHCVPHDLFDAEKMPEAIPIDLDWIANLEEGKKIEVIDTRKKKRRFFVAKKFKDSVILNGDKTVYLGTGTKLVASKNRSAEIGELPPIEHVLLLRIGDIFTIHRNQKLGELAIFDKKGRIIKKAHISCHISEIFDVVKVGEPVLFDDGKIQTEIVEVREGEFDVKVIRAKALGTKLKAEKGINFPETTINVGGLTEKDKTDLEFVIKHADVVNFSFVNSSEDVQELLDLFEEMEAPEDLGVILKIETRKAYENLSDILLTAMKLRITGVMIARGDLAVETGWDQIGIIQKEILSMCNAAHTPVVWATQVLENLAKKGLPSRSEITDAVQSIKADCVMLNKGLYIDDAITLLDVILTDQEKYNDKNEAQLPKLEV